MKKDINLNEPMYQQEHQIGYVTDYELNAIRAYVSIKYPEYFLPLDGYEPFALVFAERLFGEKTNNGTKLGGLNTMHISENIALREFCKNALDKDSHHVLGYRFPHTLAKWLVLEFGWKCQTLKPSGKTQIPWVGNFFKENVRWVLSKRIPSDWKFINNDALHDIENLCKSVLVLFQQRGIRKIGEWELPAKPVLYYFD